MLSNLLLAIKNLWFLSLLFMEFLENQFQFIDGKKVKQCVYLIIDPKNYFQRFVSERNGFCEHYNILCKK